MRSDTARKLKAAAQPVSAPDPIVDPRWVEFGRPPEYYTPQFGEFHASFMQRVESRLVHRRAAIAANLPSRGTPAFPGACRRQGVQHLTLG